MRLALSLPVKASKLINSDLKPVKIYFQVAWKHRFLLTGLTSLRFHLTIYKVNNYFGLSKVQKKEDILPLQKYTFFPE